MEKILISACLLGEKVRYHGGHAYCANSILDKWKEEGRLVLICPEISAGLSVPRPPSEIVGRGGGDAVLCGDARVEKEGGKDYSKVFLSGAKNALAVAQMHKIKVAILKDGSPSCGSIEIYSGDFSGKRIEGLGVTAAILKRNGVVVFSEKQIDLALKEIKKLEKSLGA